jgi:hypothetical protein
MTTDSPDSTDQLDRVAKGGHPCLNIFVSTPSQSVQSVQSVVAVHGRREEVKRIRG